MKLRGRRLVAGMLFLAMAAKGYAVTFTWGSAPISSVFETGTNWSGTVAPAAGSDLAFGFSSQPSVVFGASIGINSLTVNNVGDPYPAYVFSGLNSAVLGVNAGGLNVAIPGAPTVTFASSLPIALNASQTWTTGASAHLVVNSPVSGAFGLTTAGGGTLTLGATNTFSGGLTVSAGQVRVSSDANLGASSGALTLNNGVLQSTATFTLGSTRTVTLGTLGGGIGVGTGTTLTVGAVMGGTGSLTKYDNGTLVLSGANTYSGPTAVNFGTVRVGHASGLGTTAGGATVATGATLEFNGVALGAESVSLAGTGVGGAGAIVGTGTASLAGPITLAADASIGGTGTLTLSGSIGETGTRSLTKVGAGNLILTGSGSYGGATTINGGVLEVNSLRNGGIASNIGLSSNAAGNLVINGGTLRYTGPAEVIDRLFTIGTAGATIEATGSGALTFGNSGPIALGGTNTARTLTLTGSNSSNNTLASSLGNNGTGATSLVKAGTGKWTLTGANTYTGGTTISGGTLQLGNNGGDGALLGNIVNNGELRFAHNTNYTFGGVISGSGSVAKDNPGTLVLTGQNTYAGSTFVGTNGTLDIGVVNALPATTEVSLTFQFSALNVNFNQTIAAIQAGNLSSITVANGATFTISGTASLASSVSGGGALVFGTGGASTSNINGTAVHTGGTTVQAGTTLSIGGGSNSGYLGGNITNNGTINYSHHSDTDGFAGVISGPGDFVKSLSSFVTIANNQLYTGRTSLNGGTVSVDGDAKLGAAPGAVTPGKLTFNGGTLLNTASFTLNANRGITLEAGGGKFSPNAATTLTYGGIMTGTGGLTKLGLGTLVLNAANTYGGSTTINNGILQLGVNSALPSASSVQLVANVGGTVSLDVNGTSQTIAGLSFGGSGSLSSSATNVTLGAGTLNLGGNVTFSATGNPLGSAITGGTLALGAATRTFDVGNSTTAPSDLMIGSVVSGSGNWFKTGGGVLVLSGANTYTGDVTVQAGRLGTGASGSLPVQSGIRVENGAFLDIHHNSTVDGLSGAGAVALDSATTLTVASNASSLFSGTISSAGGLAKSGTGTLTLSGANSTYGGGTAVSGGTLELAASSIPGELSVVSGPVGTGPLTLLGGTMLAPGQRTSPGDGPIVLHNPVSLANDVSLGAVSTGTHEGIRFSGTVTATAVNTAVHLRGFNPIEFAGTLNGTNPGTTIVFDNGLAPERGFSFLTGTVGANVAGIVASGTAVVFNRAQALPAGAPLQVSNGGYVGVTHWLDEGSTPSSTLLLARTNANKATFSGTFGLDTAGEDDLPDTFSASLNFNGYSSNLTIGSISGAFLTGTITPPAAGYKFGNGGGLLVVHSALADFEGSKSVSVSSSSAVPENALTTIFQGNNTYSGNLSVASSLAVLDSPNALPAGRTFSLLAHGYLGYTENFTAAPTFASLASRLTAYTPTSILGFDSADYIYERTIGGGDFGDDFRFVTEPLDLTAFQPIYLGTGSQAVLLGRILAPNQGGAARRLSLIAPHGTLYVATPLRQGDVADLVVGSTSTVFRPGLVALTEANTYAGGTRLLGGVLKLDDTTRKNSGGTIVAGPIGTGALVVPSNAVRPALAASEESGLTLFNEMLLGTKLRVGFASDYAGDDFDVGGGYFSDRRIVLKGQISNYDSDPGSLAIFSNTVLNNENSFTGGVSLHFGELTIGDNGALGTGPLTVEPYRIADDTYAILSVANGYRTIENSLVINAHAGEEIAIRGNGRLTVNGSVALNSNVTFQPERYPLVLNGSVSGPGRLSVDGENAVVLAGTNSYTGGTRAEHGAIIFGSAASIPATGTLGSDSSGYVGIAFNPASLDGDFLSRFDRNSTFGTIGFDSLGESTTTITAAINLGDPPGPLNAFSGGVRLGSATRALVTGDILPRFETYKFGGGGGLLTVASNLVDEFEGDNRSVEVFSNIFDPLTVRLTGINTYSPNLGGGGDSESILSGDPVTTTVEQSALIFAESSMPESGSFRLRYGGYLGTENQEIAVGAYLSRFTEVYGNGIIGFDSFVSGEPYVLTSAITIPSIYYDGEDHARVYLGTATEAILSGTITADADDSRYRFAGYKGGRLTVASQLTGSNTVEIGDYDNPVTAGSPTDWSGTPSSVTLSGNNSYSGGTWLHAGQLLAGHSSALGTGVLHVPEMEFDFDYDYTRPFLPILGAVGAGINIANNILLDGSLRLGGSDSSSFTISGQISDGEGTGTVYKTGLNTVTLSGNNSEFSGGFYIEQGNLTFASAQAAGTGPIEMGGPLGPSVTFDANMSIQGIAGESSLDLVNIGTGRTLTINQQDDAQYHGSFASANGTIIFQSLGSPGTPQLRLLGSSNAFIGGSTVGEGIVVVASNNNAFGPSTNPVTLNGGTLALEGATLSNPLVLTSGSLGGTGTFRPPAMLVINAGDVLAPGFSAGTLNFSGTGLLAVSSTLNLSSGGAYDWDLVDAHQTLGVWDRVVVDGTVTISAIPTAPFQFRILPAPLALLNFDPAQGYSWNVLTATSINGFTGSNQFLVPSVMLNETSFPSYHFNFSLLANGGTTSLVLNFNPLAVPEPSTYAMMVVGIGAVAFFLRRRRRA